MPKQDNFALNLDGNENESSLYNADAVFGLPIKAQSIISLRQGTIEIRGCEMTPTGLVIPDGTSQDDLKFVAGVINQLEGSLQWMIGDIVAFSEARDYGDVKELAEWFNKAPKTLSNWASVCRVFGTSSRHREHLPRRAALSFSHHAEVVDCENAEELLDMAEAKSWSIARLREEINGVSPSPTVNYAKLRSIAKENNQAVFVLERLSTGDVTNEQWRKIAKILEGKQ